jgi:hypothetical protein
MKSLKLTLPLVALTGFVLAGCPSDDIGQEGSSSTGEEPTTTSPTTTPTTMTTDPDTTAGTVEMTSSSGTATDDSTTGPPPPGPFVFDETPYEDYVQVDRKGFPAVNTGLNLLGDKDAYNAASPQDDVALMFATNIFESLETLHLGAPGMQTPDNTGLDDDLAAFGLDPCITPPLPMDSCDDQGGPFAIPDVLVLDLDDPPGFPNGRQLENPVVDVIFAVLLLDLDTHPVTFFLDMDDDGTLGPSLNPLENDVAFPGAFPYLAPPNE